MSKPMRLGKGLNALLPSAEEMDLPAIVEEAGPYRICPLAMISANPYQPRMEMESEALQNLADSIRESGILQPLVVRELADGRYELIAGERRLRAAKLAGLLEVPVLLKEGTPQDRLELALVENIQRENLNPFEEAAAYYRLVKEFNLTQEEVAKRVGKERSTVANSLRIMQLPDFAKEDVANGRLSAGHARVLLSLEAGLGMRELRDQIIERQLTVRQAEEEAKKLKGEKRAVPRKGKPAPSISESYCRTLANNLNNYLGAKSKIIQNGERGRLEIEYYSVSDLERLLALIVKAEG